MGQKKPYGKSMPVQNFESPEKPAPAFRLPDLSLMHWGGETVESKNSKNFYSKDSLLEFVKSSVKDLPHKIRLTSATGLPYFRGLLK